LWIAGCGVQSSYSFDYALYSSIFVFGGATFKKSTVMKVLLDIKDEKASFFMEILKNFSFVKATPITSEKATLIQDIKEAVEELVLVREGKLEARNAEDLINEL
jgi:hypothetical protein